LIRLQRTLSRAGQIGFILGLVVLLGGLGWLLLTRADHWLMYLVGGGSSLVAVLLFFMGVVQQTFALVTPETVVECDALEFPRGKSIGFRFRQPGSASFESLRANLVGEKMTRVRSNWQTEHLGTFNFFDSGSFDAPIEKYATCEVPAEIEPSRDDAWCKVIWKIEVWGKIRRRADFQHVYRVEVV
jgi:hypothetical protein